MNRRVRAVDLGPQSLDPRFKPKQSFSRLAIADSLFLLGVVTMACGAVGLADDVADSLVLIGFGFPILAVGYVGRQSFERRHRPTPSEILSGLAFTWVALVVAGAGIYLGTGAITSVDDAVVESAAGFSTVALTTLDPSELSVPMQLWRAATQWVGGLIGIVAGVVALPMALRGARLAAGDDTDVTTRLVPSPMIGRQRVVIIYFSLTAGFAAAYAVVGMGTRNSISHALTTLSTGGFSTQTDSFVSFGTGARIVATIGMLIGGLSYFVIWWAIKGKATTLLRSSELRLYLGIVAAGTLLVWLGADGLSVGNSLFTTVSAASTTGYAVTDWTLFDDSVLTILLVIIATGSMMGSAGGGLRVIRARTLVDFASRELRRQLDPHAVVVVKHDGRAISEAALDRTTGYQIAHMGLCAAAAFLLAAGGEEFVGSIYTGISVVSTNGPGVGSGAFGSLEGFSSFSRLALVPFMLAGRLSVLPLLLGIVWMVQTEKTMLRRLRRLATTSRK